MGAVLLISTTQRALLHRVPLLYFFAHKSGRLPQIFRKNVAFFRYPAQWGDLTLVLNINEFAQNSFLTTREGVGWLQPRILYTTISVVIHSFYFIFATSKSVEFDNQFQKPRNLLTICSPHREWGAAMIKASAFLHFNLTFSIFLLAPGKWGI